MRDDGTVAEMVNEVLMRQAKARADRSGEPIEAAMGAVVRTEAGRQLAALRDGPHADESVEEWQAGIARERARERAEALGGSPRRGPAPTVHAPGGPAGGEEGPMSFWEELYVSMLVSGTVRSGMSALALAFCVRVEAGRHAWGWAAPFAFSTLCAAYCFGRLL